MKFVFTIIGVLTLAQWVFVGLLHGFLVMQEKNSPETFDKLHRIPVIGGYFPVMDLPTEEDKDREHADEMRLRMLEAKRDFDLPKAFDPESLQALVNELKEKSAQLDEDRKGLDARESEVQTLIGELNEREGTINDRQSKLAEMARNVELAKRELQLLKSTVEGARSEIEEANLKKMAKFIEVMKPDKAREQLVGDVASIKTEEERENRFVDAARILNYTSAEVSAAILERMDPVEFVRIQRIMKTLPTGP